MTSKGQKMIKGERKITSGIKAYGELNVQPVPVTYYGKCPRCRCKNSKIIWGWHETYYDMICENGHSWTYKFREPTKKQMKLTKKGRELMVIKKREKKENKQ